MKKKAIITFVFAAITMGVWAQNTDDRQESDQCACAIPWWY